MKLNQLPQDVYPLDQMENNIVSIFLNLCEDLGSIEAVSDTVFEMYAKAEASSSKDEKEKFTKILGFFRSITDVVSEDSEALQDLLKERNSHKNGTLPKQT